MDQENTYTNKRNAGNAVPLLNLDRPKPHNEEAEKAVLGAMLIDPTAAAAALANLRFEGAFFRAAHQMIFAAMLELYPGKGDAGLDVLVLTDHLQKNGRLDEVGGPSYLAMLADCVPTAANIEHYIDIVKQNAILRRVISSCSEAILRCYDSDDDIKTVLDYVEQKIFEVAQMNESKDLLPIQPLVKEAVSYIQKLMQGDNTVMGLKTGFDQLDRLITGLRPGELFVLAARPSIGKTALALNIAANIALGPAKVPVGIFSLEMPAQQLVLRLLCSEAKVCLARLINVITPPKSTWSALQEACMRLLESHILIDDTGAIDILELRAKARRMKSTANIGVIFIDYLQLIHTDAGRNASRENEVSKISGALKALAKELNIPIVVLAQLNRQAEQNEKPKLSNLRESGAIEQDADVVTLLHREREKQYQQGENSSEGLEAELIVAKNRNGATGVQNLLFFPQHTRFESRSKVDDSDVKTIQEI
ncbi:MAG: replicative DNA helicase [Oligosphaeraceae bacterium]|nr:replicative DNA helicase [Oligosphaeraceae bacterium]